MITKTKLLAAVLGLSLAVGPVGCSSEPDETERWAATANTNVNLDWDKVNEAYKQAEGPEDLEKRLNEIYEGDEIISVHVEDKEDKTQVVTGFFDKDSSGTVEEPEKIFTIKREVTGEGQAQYQTSGHGHYAGYHSPFMGIATGMLLGSMMSSMFMPGYVGMYRQPYSTSSARLSSINGQRSSYRAANPGRFSRQSQSGRSYGGGKSSGGTSRSRGGSRFGHVTRRGQVRVRLTA
ncbi:MAG: hypothetical protein H0X17_09880 [Deltaproteobacteria bacterium]|nr:hypothetical protein [Deltaproteobacteria bacterium]